MTYVLNSYKSSNILNQQIIIFNQMFVLFIRNHHRVHYIIILSLYNSMIYQGSNPSLHTPSE